MQNTVQAPPRRPTTPDCDQLATGEIWAYWRDHFSHPPLFNDLGCFRTGPDVMGIYNFMFPPFSGNGEGTAMLHINRRHLPSQNVQVGYTWHPDRVVRRAHYDGLDIETVTRALPNEPGALLTLTLKNPVDSIRKVEVGIKVAGRMINTVEGWASIGPTLIVEQEQREVWQFSDRAGGMVIEGGDNAFSCQGSLPMPDEVEGKALIYHATIPARGEWTLKFVVGIGETADRAIERFRRHLNAYDESAQLARDQWDDRFQKAFEPGNDLYSGNLPTLVIDNEDVKRLYNMATLGCLTLRRDNPLAAYRPAYVTLSPNYWTTASFLWDMMIAAPFYALLDPAVMRQHIEVWLKADLLSYLATDYVTGKGLGYWYAVNSTAIVRLAYNYLRFSGDMDWLDKRLDGRPIIDLLQEHALMWHTYDKHGHGLADCGGILNLLECVTTYTHGVASFNAMWVAALRQVGKMRRLRGELGVARELEQDADGLLRNVLNLYVPGKGFWRCRQPDGGYNDVHHIYDFVAVLESIAEDLPPHVREEMAQNFFREHQTSNWTRSLSTWDEDVHRSLRVDHQWTGSYTSISAQAINGLYKIGHGNEGFEWLQQLSLVAHQGPIGQAHWIDPLFPSYKGGPWKCTYIQPFITDWTCASNGAYPAMIIESVFGVDATLDEGLKFKGVTPALEKGARLENLCYQGRLYNVDRHGITPAG